VISPTSVSAEMKTLVMFERPNVAVSADPFGTVAGVQFAAVFQSPESGLRSHVALPARVALGDENNPMTMANRPANLRRRER